MSIFETNVRSVAARALVSLIVGMTTFLAPVRPIQALSFNVTYDPSVLSAPAGFIPAFTTATTFFERSFIDPITINLYVGWGVDGSLPVSPGTAGEASTPLQMVFPIGFPSFNSYMNYNAFRTALIGDASSFADTIATSAASLPSNDPTGGLYITMAPAEAKALGLRSATDPAIDASIGFNTTIPWAFGPDRAVAGEYDFIGVAEHEISHAMGRIAVLQQISGTALPRVFVTPLDLYRYSKPGTLALTPFAVGPYFSINDGKNKINTFAQQYDLADWLGLTVDSFNLFAKPGEMKEVSPGDIQEMDVIGYDTPPPVGCGFLTVTNIGPPPIPSPCSADLGSVVDPDAPPDVAPMLDPGSLPDVVHLGSIPEPGSLVLLGVGLVTLGLVRRHFRRNSNREDSVQRSRVQPS